MRKISGVFILFLLASIAHAQQASLWINGGATVATQIQSEKGDGTRKSTWGPDAGIFIHTTYASQFGFETGLFYTAKGAQFPDINSTVHLNYAGAFGSLFLNFPLQGNSNFYVGPGIFAAEAISGKSKGDSAYNIDFGNVWKRFDIGFQVRTGFMIKQAVGIGVHYDISAVPAYTSTYLTRQGNANKGRNSSFTFFAALKLASLKRK